MEQQLRQLEKRVSDLLALKKQREAQRLTFPLNQYSQDSLNKADISPLVFTGKTFADVITTLASFADIFTFGLELHINGVKRYLYSTYPFLRATVNTGTNFVTNFDGAHNLDNGDTIFFATTGTMPAPLDVVTNYFIVNRTGSTFQVALTAGGSAIDITTSGTGILYYIKYS